MKASTMTGEGKGMPGAVMEAPPGKGKMPSGGEGVAGIAMEAQTPEEEYSVFTKPGESVPAAALAALGPYTHRGSTANFDVYCASGRPANEMNGSFESDWTHAKREVIACPIK